MTAARSCCHRPPGRPLGRQHRRQPGALARWAAPGVRGHRLAGRRQLWMRTLDELRGPAARRHRGRPLAVLVARQPVAGVRREREAQEGGSRGRSGGHLVRVGTATVAPGTATTSSCSRRARRNAGPDPRGGRRTLAGHRARRNGRARFRACAFRSSSGRPPFHLCRHGLGEGLPVYLASLDSRERTRLPIEAHSCSTRKASWCSPRHHAHGAALRRRRQALPGKRFRSRNSSGWTPFPRASYFSVSASGMLVFQEDPSPGYELVWFDREGRPTGTLGRRRLCRPLALTRRTPSVLVSIAEPPARATGISGFRRGARSPHPVHHRSRARDAQHMVAGWQSHRLRLASQRASRPLSEGRQRGRETKRYCSRTSSTRTR